MLSQAAKEILLRERGLSSDTHDIDEGGRILPKAVKQPAVSSNGLPQPKPVSPLETAAREAIHAAPATAAGGLGAAGGMALGAEMGSPFGPAGIAIGGVIGGLAGGFGLGAGTAAVQQKLEEKYAPEYLARLEANRAANPNAAMAGRIATLPIGGMGASVKNLTQGAAAVPMAVNALKSGGGISGVGRVLASPQGQAAANVGLGTAIGVGAPVGMALGRGENLGDAVMSRETLEGLIGGAIFSEPNRLGRSMGFHATPRTETEALRANNSPAAQAMQRELMTRITAAKAQEEAKISAADAPRPAPTSRYNLDPQGLLAAVSSTMNPIMASPKTAGQPYVIHPGGQLRGVNVPVRRKVEVNKAVYDADGNQIGLVPQTAPDVEGRSTTPLTAAEAESQRRAIDFDKAQVELKAKQPVDIVGANWAERDRMQRVAEAQKRKEALAKLEDPALYPEHPTVHAEAQAEADRIQLEIEQKANRRWDSDDESQAGGVFSKEQAQAEKAAKEFGPLTKFYELLFDRQAKARGADVSNVMPEKGDTSKGYVRELVQAARRMAAFIHPNQTADTRAHEAIGHIAFTVMKNSPHAEERAFATEMLQQATDSPQYKQMVEARKKWNAANPDKKPLRLIDPEEYIAMQQGFEYVIRAADKKSGDGSHFWAQARRVLGRATEADMRRIMHENWHAPSDFDVKYLGAKAGGDAAKVVRSDDELPPEDGNIPSDEGFNSNDGDEAMYNAGFNEAPMNDATSRPLLPDEITSKQLADADPDQVVSWKKRVKFGPQHTMAIAKKMTRADYTALVSEHNFMVTKENAMLKAMKNATNQEQLEAIISYYNPIQLKKQTLNETLQDYRAIHSDEDFGQPRVNSDDESQVPQKPRTVSDRVWQRKLNYDAYIKDLRARKSVAQAQKDVGNRAVETGQIDQAIDASRNTPLAERKPLDISEANPGPQLATKSQDEILVESMQKIDNLVSVALDAAMRRIRNASFSSEKDFKGLPSLEVRRELIQRVKMNLIAEGVDKDGLRASVQRRASNELNKYIADQNNRNSSLNAKQSEGGKEFIEDVTQEDAPFNPLENVPDSEQGGDEVVDQPENVDLGEEIELETPKAKTATRSAAQWYKYYSAKLDDVRGDAKAKLEAVLSQLAEGDLTRNLTADDISNLQATTKTPLDKLEAEYEKAADKYDETGDMADKEHMEELERKLDEAYGRKNSDDESRAFKTETETLLESGLEGAKKLVAPTFWKKLRQFIPAGEIEMLNALGFKDFVQKQGMRVDIADTLRWIKANEPKVQVHTYGAEGKVSEAAKELGKMQHEWYERLDSKKSIEYQDALSYAEDKAVERDIDTNYKMYVPSYLEKQGWTHEEINTAKKYIQLQEAIAEDKGVQGINSMTGQQVGAYNRVSPKDPKVSPVTRVDVVLNKNVDKAHDISDGAGGIANKNVLWSPDSLHEQHPNTLGWAAIQYETLPNGEKVAHIFEAQSRWGQTYKKELARRESQPMADSSYGKTQTPNHPLLAEYNRLILKAAMQQARKEGATHIAISDAETAMMTEGHDVQHQWQVVDSEGNVLHEPAGQAQAQAYYKEWKKYNAEKRAKIQPIVSQESGMRLNYDTILPDMLKKLTGDKGERVSFGEHKNAFDVGTHIDRANRTTSDTFTPRDNLIFKNPDGTPKTDVTANVYKLPPERPGEPNTYFGKRYSDDESQATRRSIYTTPGIGKVLLKSIAPEIEKLHAISPEAAKGAEKFYDIKRELTGKYEQTLVRELEKIREPKNLAEWFTEDNADYQAVVKWLDAKQDGLEPGFDLTPTQEAIYGALDRNLDTTYKAREAREKLATGKGRKDFYLPETMSREVADTLAANTDAAKTERYKQLFLKFRTEVKGQQLSAAEGDWKTLRNQFSLPEDGNIAARFGAIDKAMGLGLPTEMRSQHLLDRMSRFNRRNATRFAYHDAIESQPAVHAAFFDSEKSISGSKPGKHILENIFGHREHDEATRNAASGLVRALMLGPLTGAKDIAASQFLGLQHMDFSQVVGAKISALKNWKENYEKAIEHGIVRFNIGALETGEGGARNIHRILGRVRDAINTVQGRQLAENTARVLNFGEGKHLALDAIRALQSGRLSGQKRGFLEDFVENWQQYKDAPIDAEDLNRAAAKYVESVQGTYGYKGLPSAAVTGTVAPVVSLQRWSIEKFNNFNKHVTNPALNGNFKPLLMSTVGMLIGGAAVNEIIEMATGREQKAATLKEIELSPEKAELLTYKMLTLASLAGYTGVMADVGKSFGDMLTGNKVQTWNNPLLQAIGTSAEQLKFIAEAVREGDLPSAIDTIDMFMSDYIQAYRIGAAQVMPSKKEEAEKANKRRDLRVFEQGHGYPSSRRESKRPNPLVDAEMRQFKRTDDMREAMQLAPALVRKAIKDANGNPEQLKANLSKLRRNSYQTMPSPERNPVKFAQYGKFLRETQSPAARKERVMDYMKQNNLNRAKSSFIPSL